MRVAELLVQHDVAAHSPGSQVTSITVNFAPHVAANPNTATSFNIRLVLLNAQNQPLSPVSQTVKIDYTLPGAGTNLEQSMKLFLTKAECLAQTDGPGSDDIVITILGAAVSSQGNAKVLFRHYEADIDDDWAINPSKQLWEYRGLGFTPNVYILAAIAEEDEQPIVAGFYSAYSNVPNSMHQTGKLLEAFSKELCKADDHECIGSPQFIPVTQADWNKVALQHQTVTKQIRFIGLGGRYRLTFELRP